MKHPANQNKNQQIEMRKKDYFALPAMKNKLEELLGKNAASFATSVLQITNSNELLKRATNESVFNAACMAATLNLPINNAFGFAYIIPYEKRKENIVEAQFQLGYKGLIQLAQRSGQFKQIEVCAVYENDTDEDVFKRLTSFIPKKGYGEIIGYISYFKLLNGYEARLFMDMDELKQHATKYSKSYKNGYGNWADNFEAMASKTVVKLLLSKQAPLSIDMQKAIQADQSVIKDIDGEFSYIDNEPEIGSKKSDEQALVAAFQNQQAKTAEATKPTPTEEQFAELVEAVSTGEKEVSDVLENYNLTDKQKAEINAL